MIKKHILVLIYKDGKRIEKDFDTYEKALDVFQIMTKGKHNREILKRAFIGH